MSSSPDDRALEPSPIVTEFSRDNAGAPKVEWANRQLGLLFAEIGYLTNWDESNAGYNIIVDESL